MPPWRQRLAEHVADAVEQVGDLGAGQLVGGPRAVQPGPPERLVGVDVADPADQRLVEQRALDLGVPAAQRGGERRRRRSAGSSGSIGDVREPRRGSPSRRRRSSTAQPAEGALVDEAQLPAAVGEGEAGAQVRLVGRRRASPPAAGRSCRGGRPGSRGGRRLGSGSHRYLPRRCAAVNVRRSARDEVLGALEVPADGARVVHLDGGDGAAGDPASSPRRTTSTSGSSGTPVRRRPGGVAAPRRPSAARARRPRRPPARRPSWCGRCRCRSVWPASSTDAR